MRLTAANLALGATLLPIVNAQDVDSNGLIDLDLALDLAGLDISAAVDILCFPTETITQPPPTGGIITTTATETATLCPVREDTSDSQAYDFFFSALRSWDYDRTDPISDGSNISNISHFSGLATMDCYRH